MLIAVDPTELMIVSETLRGCAIEAADIGSQLLACASCPMPAEIQSVVDGVVREADRALDSMAGELSAYSVDLTNRAQIAMTDSLAAATTAFNANPTLNTAISNASGPGMSIAGGQGLTEPIIFGTSPPLGMSIIGGQGLTEPIIFGSAPAAAGVANLTVSSIGGGPMGDVSPGGGYPAGAGIAGMSTIGGSPGSLGGYGNPGGVGSLIAAPGPGEGTSALGFPTPETLAVGSVFQPMGGGVSTFAPGSFNPPNPNSAAAFNTQMTVLNGATNAANLIFAPSRPDLDRGYGYPLTDSQVRADNPYTPLGSFGN